jgi:4-alpha-glucanotransferase
MRTLFDTRSSGVLLHPSSLPGPHGAGDLGPAAYRFVDFLARAGQRWWQMLPVCPLGAGNSPYDSPSAFAGNPLLVSLEFVREDGLLEQRELDAPRGLVVAPRVPYPAARRFRERRLRRAFARFEGHAGDVLRHSFHEFRERSRNWLPDFALFSALRGKFGARPWTSWEPELVARKPEALERARRELGTELHYAEFLQFVFDRQWRRLHAYARERRVKLLGDVPMYVAHDGADVWGNQPVFKLDERGERRVLAGVPPDYFSADGQLWGNPVYDWDALRASDYAWWIARLGHTLERFDAVRLDHFIGFHRCWEVAANATSARHGDFRPVPGSELFRVAEQAFSGLPFVAEDLGLLTNEVRALRDSLRLPGMRVLEFAFSDDDFREYQPHRFNKECVVYTGTHDNDTLVGWLEAPRRVQDPVERRRLEAERSRALAYAGSSAAEPHWGFIRCALASVANTAIFPLQDLLGQGSEARMNVPGTASGNWEYRARTGDASDELADRLRELVKTYERLPNDA